jgi:hypothetical protein
VDRYRFNTDPDIDSYFHVYVDLHPDPDLDQYPDPDLHQNGADPLADPTSSLRMLETRNSQFNNVFPFLISVIIFSILGTILKFLEKVYFSFVMN